MKKEIHFHFPPWLIYLIIVVLTLELSPFILSPLVLKQGFHRSEIKNEIGVDKQTTGDDTTSSRTDKNEYLGEHYLHPYLGYVHIPGGAYNIYGFLGADPLEQTDSNIVKICITGGSVAKQLFQNEEGYIVRKLLASSNFAGKKIKTYALALGGFKQPQQLFSLNYFMAEGAYFDYVINLDGFNEIVLPLCDNYPFGVHPSFPRHWNIYSRKKLDSQVLQQLGKEAWLVEQREDSRINMQSKIWRFSNFALFIWKISDLNKGQKILETENRLREKIATPEKDIQSTGPAYSFSDTLKFLQQQASFWAQCSRQMNAVTQESGGVYIHFLQPNQYDKGSKPLTNEEMALAFESGPFAYKTAARMGYPMLRKEGEKLKSEGSRFVDLTGMFISDKRTLYSDKCCHFNELGYQLIADRIVMEILRE